MKRVFLLAVVLGLTLEFSGDYSPRPAEAPPAIGGGVASAELPFKSLSVTDVSQTYTFRPSEFVGLCNRGVSPVFFRLFWEGETTAAATTANHELPAGTSEAPFCWSVDRAVTQPAFWVAISIVADTGDTATVHLQTE